MAGSKMFPVWSPGHWRAARKLRSDDPKVRYKALRGSSSRFTRRPDVREFIFERDNYKCVFCGSSENLTIDHKISVYTISRNLNLIEILNTESNLQTACNKCNAGKTHGHQI